MAHVKVSRQNDFYFTFPNWPPEIPSHEQPPPKNQKASYPRIHDGAPRSGDTNPRDSAFVCTDHPPPPAGVTNTPTESGNHGDVDQESSVKESNSAPSPGTPEGDSSVPGVTNPLLETDAGTGADDAPLEQDSPAPAIGFRSAVPFAATAASTGNWGNNQGPFVSPTHDFAQPVKSTQANTSTLGADSFLIGGATGAAISKIRYCYDDGATTSFNFSLIKVSEAPTLKIAGIIDTTAASKTILYDSQRLPIGQEFPLAGGYKLQFQKTYEGATSTRDCFSITFKDPSGQPTRLEIPANTQVDVNWLWSERNPSRIPASPTRATIFVDGVKTGTDVTPPTDGGSDPDVGTGVCAATGGTVWVGRSAHSNPGQTFNERNTTQLFTQEYGSTKFTAVGPETNWVYNALAYNPKDGYLYAVSQGRIKTIASTSSNTQTYDEDPRYPAGHLLKISPVNGAVQDLGKINGIQSQRVGTWPNDLWGGITSGTILSDGTYVFSNSSQSGTKNMYTLSWGATGYSKTAARRTGTELNSNDYTYLVRPDGTTSDWVYGIQNGSSILERVNVRTGVRQQTDLSRLTDPLGNRVPSGIYGTTWTYPNGNLGFGLNGQLTGFQVKVIEDASGFRAELVNKVPVPTSQSNDAASNALVIPKTDLKVEKVLKEIRNNVATWEIKVTNLGPCGSSGFNVDDLVPNSYRNVRITQTTAGWVSSNLQPQVNGQQVVALHGPLRKDESATLTLQADVASSINGCVENTASVLGNEGDDKTANNTASDGGCSLDIRKDVVDVDNNGVIDAKDSAAPGPNGTRTISYEIVVSNPKDGTQRTYTLSDTPRFSKLVNVVGGKVSSAQITQGSKTLPGTGPWELARDIPIAPGTTHRYRVEVNYNPPSKDVSQETTAQCVDGKSDNGLFNNADLTWDGGQKKDDACAPVTNDRDVTLKVKKLNADGSTTPLTGAQFTIHAVNSNGTLGAVVKPLSAADQDGFYTAVLKPDTQYFLVENRSPADFMLLPSPVKFRLSEGATDRDPARVEILSDSLAVESTQSGNASPTIAYMSVSNVHKGNLPKTGSDGYYRNALAGLALAALGLCSLLLRRKTA